jgi:hypothetical protein
MDILKLKREFNALHSVINIILRYYKLLTKSK